MKNNVVHRPGRGGFTLVEVLTAVAVLAIIIVIVAQMLSKAQTIIVLSRKQLDVDDQARLVFSRISNDLTNIVKRSDADMIFAKQAGNDEMFFFSQSVGDTTNGGYSGAENPLSLVGYAVAADPTIATVTARYNDLQRLGRGLNWFANSGNSPESLDNMVFLAANPTTTSWWNTLTLIDGHWGPSSAYTPAYNSTGAPPTYTQPTGNPDPDWHTIGDEVFRLEYCFLLRDGSYADYPCEANSANVVANATPLVEYAGPPGTNDDANSDGQSGLPIGTGTRWFDTNAGRAYICTNSAKNAATWQGLGLRDVAAVIVAIAMVDRNSRSELITIKGATGASKYNALGGATIFANSGLPTQGSGAGITWKYSTANPSNYATLKLMAQNWNSTINQQTTFVSSIATATGLSSATATQFASHISVYQRFIYLNTATPL